MRSLLDYMPWLLSKLHRSVMVAQSMWLYYLQIKVRDIKEYIINNDLIF